MSTLKDLQDVGSVITDPETGGVLLRFDNNLEEKYVRTAEVTQYPVEEGAPITDHHQAQQRTLELFAEVSNTPLVFETDRQNRAQFYYDVLDALVLSGRRLTITSGLRVFENCVIKDYSITRDYTSGQSLVVSMTVVEIQTVSTSEVEVPEAILQAALRATGRTRRKKVVAPQAPTEEQAAVQAKAEADPPKRSLALQGLRALGGLD